MVNVAIIVGFQFFCFISKLVVDSWGKIPSSVLTGNLFGLGSITECLNIQRNEKKYDSQYCLAEISAEMTGVPPDGLQTQKTQAE